MVMTVVEPRWTDGIDRIISLAICRDFGWKLSWIELIELMIEIFLEFHLDISRNLKVLLSLLIFYEFMINIDDSFILCFCLLLN